MLQIIETFNRDIHPIYINRLVVVPHYLVGDVWFEWDADSMGSQELYETGDCAYLSIGWNEELSVWVNNLNGCESLKLEQVFDKLTSDEIKKIIIEKLNKS